MDIGLQLEKGAKERIRGFDRSRKILSYHVCRLHRKAKKYSKDPADEERYLRTLRTLGYMMQVLTAAQRTAFEEELSVVEKAMEEYDRIRVDYQRLRELEAQYVEIKAQTKRESEG